MAKIKVEENTFLGRGWSFPPAFSRGGHGVNMVDDEEDIRQSLLILLATARGERVMQPDFGANMDELLFERLSVSVAQRVSARTKKAILFFEPRVKVDDVNFVIDAANGIVEIRIDYTVIATNNRRNIVYPYYLTEGTDIV
ncbi:GPW/gp25 family protein [Mangrovibacterium sp.]|uniref:GPW/gp25 family protein n=1 Tax=Mangrovibacterium sp. TaxID=1961364 RepID=UPI0035636E86